MGETYITPTALILPLINSPASIDDVLLDHPHIAGKGKLYKHFRECFDYTPGAFRKRYRKTGYRAQAVYEINRWLNFDTTRFSLDPLVNVAPNETMSPLDEPVGFRITHAMLHVNGVAYVIEVDALTRPNRWYWYRLELDGLLLAINIQRNGGETSMVAMICHNTYRPTQANFTYQLEITLNMLMVGYARPPSPPSPQPMRYFSL